MTLGDRIAVMKEGAVRQIGTPLELYERPADLFVATFIGSPPMNLLRGRIKAGEGLRFVHPAFDRPLVISRDFPGLPSGTGEVILGIRPEHLALGDSATSVLTATVEVVEPVGAETLLFVRKEDLSLVLRIPGIRPFVPGSPVPIAFDAARPILFDPGSERALG